MTKRKQTKLVCSTKNLKRNNVSNVIRFLTLVIFGKVSMKAVASDK